MSAKLYIDESDDGRTRIGKMERATACYGRELFNACKTSDLCSEDVKMNLTLNMCHTFAYKFVYSKFWLAPCGKVFELETGSVNTVLDVMAHFSIRREEVNILLVNGFHQKPEFELKDGDVVSLFPAVGGG